MTAPASPPAPALRSGIYSGRVTHRRLRPRAHALGYRVFYLLLDLDEIDALDRGLRLFSRDRFNLLSFRERDHAGGAPSLRPRIAAMVAEAGVAGALGRIALLTMPRLLGHVFNPLSVYFCHAPDERLLCLVYEVNNTFGQRHSYVVPVADGAEPIRQSAPKRFYVSPFLDMDLTYDFTVRPPGADVSVAVVARDATGPMIATAFAGRRTLLSDANLLRAVLGHPLLTVKVVAAIHWEALLIWLKGVGLRPRPPAPDAPTTTVPLSGTPGRPLESR